MLLGCASMECARQQAAADDDLVALSFSGGGTRAAAFSFGVLEEMEHTPVRGGGGSYLIDSISFPECPEGR